MHIRITTFALGTLALGATATVEHASGPTDAGPGMLAETTPMAVARAAHSATALPDGRVLVAGGFTVPGSAAGAELYDPVTSRFDPLPPMRTTRHSHTATLMPDGRVLLVGGYGTGNTALATAEWFDPATRRFTPAGALTQPRAGHVAVLLADGRVMLAGGVGPGWTFLATAELFDPVAGTFARTGAMGTARESHVGVRLDDGRVLVVGGHRGRRADIVLHASAELYDPDTGTFTPTGAMRIRRHKHDAVRLPDGRVLVTGGTDERDSRGIHDTSELYDPGTGTFAEGGRLQRGRYKHAGSSLVLPTGMVLIGGGASRAELHDPRRRRSQLVEGRVALAGQFAAVAPLPDGGALITGGYGGGTGPRSTAWRYRP
jgi:hypothetical protein